MLDGTDPSSTKILLIEDDERLGEIQRDFLTKNGFSVLWQTHGRNIPQTIATYSPDILVLDLVLPGTNGLDICREVRQDFNGKIIVVTSSDDDFDHVTSLELGADNFLTKPINLRVLLAHLRALLRRDSPSQSQKKNTQRLEFGNLAIKLKTREVVLNNNTIQVSGSEFNLLWHLALNADEVMDRNTLFQATRGIDFDGSDRSIDTKVVALRKKLLDSAKTPKKIITVRNQGYLFSSDAWD